MSVTMRSSQTIRNGIRIIGSGSSVRLFLNAGNYAGGSVWPDVSGYHNDAQLPVFLDFVGNGQASYWTFNGTDYAYMPMPVTQDMTWLIWFQTSDSDGDPGGSWFSQPMIIGGELPGDTFDMGIAMAQGHIIWGMGQTDTTMVSNDTYNDNIWHQLAVTRNTATGVANIYVDGVLDKTQSGFPTGARINDYLGIAYNYASGDKFWSGNISEIIACNTVLTSGQIANAFASERSRYGV